MSHNLLPKPCYRSAMASFTMPNIPEHLLQKNQEESPENLALFEAARTGDLEGCKKLLVADPQGKPNFINHKAEQQTALHVASSGGHVDIIKLLVQNGAQVGSLVGTTKDTALQLAVSHNQPQAADALIALGSDVNAENCYGNTPLHAACENGLIDVVKALLSAGAVATAANRKGSTPLHFICYREEAGKPNAAAVELVKLLVTTAGVPVNVTDHRGMTPLLACCVSGRMDLIHTLISLGADTHARDKDGRGAYDIGVFFKQDAVAKFFMDSPMERFASTSTLSTDVGGMPH
jgi:ankyrin repeat protein